MRSVSDASQEADPDRGFRIGAWLVRILVGAIAAGILYLGVIEAQRSALIPKGAAAPEFKAARFKGGDVALGELKGNVVMLDFWATWCGPCVSEMPSLVKLAKEYEGKGLVFLAANQDDPDDAESRVEAFVAKRVPDLGRFVVFPEPLAAQAYKVNALPTLYFIGRDGKVLEGHSGAASEATLRKWIERALAAN